MSVDNKVLMLSLISTSSRQGWLGITKLQKLSFLTEYFLFQNGKRAFDYEFFMYDLGPISTGAYRDLEFLLNEELVTEDEDGIRSSELGESINNQFREIIPKEINSAMQYVVNEYASMRTNDLVELVHRIKIKLPDGRVTCIGNVPRSHILLAKPLTTICERAFGKKYLETFRILSNRPLIEAIREARKSRTKSKPYEPLVSS